MTVKATDSWNTCLNTTLEQEDKEIYDIVENEKLRQWSGLELIASEVCTSARVLTCFGHYRGSCN